MKIVRKGAAPSLQEHIDENGVTFLRFDAFDSAAGTRHAFATRLGGDSKPPYDTMNLSFTRGDDPADVLENYRRMTAVLDASPDDVVCTYQTHTTNLRIVTASDRGKGVTREREYTDIDGLLTNERGVVLSCFWADCVPLLFADPVHHAIGVAHAGWRGSVGGIAGKMIDALHTQYDTAPEDLWVAVGPSICGDCYEIGEDVADDVLSAYPDAKKHRILFQKEDAASGKYRLDLWKLNYCLLSDAGVPSGRIFTTDICTRCNPDLLFSHRICGEARGNLAAFLKLA